MTLLITLFAAIISTVIWYKSLPDNTLKVGFLCLIYWAASIMWFVDSVFEYAQSGVEFFNPEFSEVMNDMFLGLSAVALGLLIWIIYIIIKDPKKVLYRFSKSKGEKDE